MAYDVDTKPGRWVREQTARRERRILLGVGIGFLATGIFLWFAVGHRVGVGASLAFLFAALLVRERGNRYVDLHLRLRRGALAEEAVGATLEELESEGWIVMHDIARPGQANIDHIASGPHGVYLIETKAHGYKPWHLRRTMEQALWLHEQLVAFVTPVICLKERRGKPFKAHGVWVVPGGDLLDWLRVQRNQPVEFERLARFADSL